MNFLACGSACSLISSSMCCVIPTSCAGSPSVYGHSSLLCGGGNMLQSGLGKMIYRGCTLQRGWLTGLPYSRGYLLSESYFRWYTLLSVLRDVILVVASIVAYNLSVVCYHA